MSEFKDDRFLSRWINNELSDDELNDFKKSADYQRYRKIVEGANLIHSGDFDEGKMLQKIKANIHSESAPRRTRWVFAVAASLTIIIGFVAYTLFFTSDITTYRTKIGQKMNLTLPDGSEVVLNANSELAFSGGEWNENREVTLQGEGYFKVEKGSKFSVVTAIGNVNVLGTQFTVKELDDFFEVICYEGSVAVLSQDQKEVLKPKTAVRKTRNTHLLKRNILLDKPTWLTNKTTFTSVPLSYVLLELKNQYGVQFAGEENLDELSFNGTFPHDDLDLALKIVLDPTNINFEKKGNVIVLSKN